jgi:protein-disulfide isomerase
VKGLLSTSALVLSMVAVPAPARGEAPQSPGSPTVAARLSALEKEQRQLADEVQGLLEELSRVPKGTPAAPKPGDPLSLENLPTKGSPEAPVVVIEYADFECPYCGSFSQQTLPAIEEDFVRTGSVEWAFASLPLQEIHPDAVDAAEAAECARRQDRFWEMHDELFADQHHLDQVSLVNRARSLGLNVERFADCVQGAGSDAVRTAAAAVRGAGIAVTPTFLIGRRGVDGGLRLVRTLVGAVDFETFKKAIDSVLDTTNRGGSR